MPSPRGPTLTLALAAPPVLPGQVKSLRRDPGPTLTLTFTLTLTLPLPQTPSLSL